MTNHYETLGVPRTATQDDIKAAYRKRRSGGAHPDHGGDDEAMRALNAAHTVLSDPASREAYDATLPDVDRDARRHLEKVLSAALDGDEDPIEAACEEVEQHIGQAEGVVSELGAKITRLRKHLKRVKFKGKGTNAAAALINRQLASTQEKLDNLLHVELVLRRTLAMLEDYDYELPEQPQPSEKNRVLAELARAHMAFAAAPYPSYPFFKTGT